MVVPKADPYSCSSSLTVFGEFVKISPSGLLISKPVSLPHARQPFGCLQTGPLYPSALHAPRFQFLHSSWSNCSSGIRETGAVFHLMYITKLIKFLQSISSHRQGSDDTITEESASLTAPLTTQPYPQVKAEVVELGECPKTCVLTDLTSSQA